MKLELTINGVSLKAYLFFFLPVSFHCFLHVRFYSPFIKVCCFFFYFRNYLSLQVGIHVSQLLSKPRHKLVHLSL